MMMNVIAFASKDYIQARQVEKVIKVFLLSPQ